MVHCWNAASYVPTLDIEYLKPCRSFSSTHVHLFLLSGCFILLGQCRKYCNWRCAQKEKGSKWNKRNRLLTIHLCCYWSQADTVYKAAHWWLQKSDLSSVCWDIFDSWDLLLVLLCCSQLNKMVPSTVSSLHRMSSSTWELLQNKASISTDTRYNRRKMRYRTEVNVLSYNSPVVFVFWGYGNLFFHIMFQTLLVTEALNSPTGVHVYCSVAVGASCRVDYVDSPSLERVTLCH